MTTLAPRMHWTSRGGLQGRALLGLQDYDSPRIFAGGQGVLLGGRGRRNSVPGRLLWCPRCQGTEALLLKSWPKQIAWKFLGSEAGNADCSPLCRPTKRRWRVSRASWRPATRCIITLRCQFTSCSATPGGLSSRKSST